MIYFKVHLDKFDWCVECFITTDNTYVADIICKLNQIGCSDYILEKAQNILYNQYDSGFAYSNSKNHKSIMVINMSTSMDEFVNTYNHEKNHIEMHICDELNIDPYSEEASDLSGYLAQAFYFAMLQSYDTK